MTPEVQLRLDKLRFSIDIGLDEATKKYGDCRLLRAIFHDVLVRANEVAFAIASARDPVERVGRLRTPDKNRRTSRT